MTSISRAREIEVMGRVVLHLRLRHVDGDAPYRRRRRADAGSGGRAADAGPGGGRHHGHGTSVAGVCAVGGGRGIRRCVGGGECGEGAVTAASDRREFLGALGAVTLGAALPHSLARRAARREGLAKIGLQLYTVRAAMAQDFEGTLARVAQVGYNEVEFAGYFGRSPEAVRAALTSAGLTAPSAHVGFDMLREG